MWTKIKLGFMATGLGIIVFLASRNKQLRQGNEEHEQRSSELEAQVKRNKLIQNEKEQYHGKIQAVEQDWRNDLQEPSDAGNGVNRPNATRVKL